MSGARIKNTLNAFVGADERVRPLRDQIVVEPMYVGLSDIIDVQWHGETIRGKVLAVGPGTYPKKYDGPKGKRTKSWDSKAFRPTEVKVGDVVNLAGLELKGYLHNTFMWGNRSCVLCREEDVAVIE